MVFHQHWHARKPCMITTRATDWMWANPRAQHHQPACPFCSPLFHYLNSTFCVVYFPLSPSNFMCYNYPWAIFNCSFETTRHYLLSWKVFLVEKKRQKCRNNSSGLWIPFQLHEALPKTTSCTTQKILCFNICKFSPNIGFPFCQNYEHSDSVKSIVHANILYWDLLTWFLIIFLVIWGISSTIDTSLLCQ